MLTGIAAGAMAGIDPAGIVAYLRASGWREAGSYGRAVIWTRVVEGAEAEVLVPVSAELRDYPTRLAELAGTLSTLEQRPVSDVLQDLRSSRLDVQYIRMMPDGPSGSTPLHEGYLAVKGRTTCSWRLRPRRCQRSGRRFCQARNRRKRVAFWTRYGSGKPAGAATC